MAERRAVTDQGARSPRGGREKAQQREQPVQYPYHGWLSDDVGGTPIGTGCIVTLAEIAVPHQIGLHARAFLLGSR